MKILIVAIWLSLYICVIQSQSGEVQVHEWIPNGYQTLPEPSYVIPSYIRPTQKQPISNSFNPESSTYPILPDSENISDDFQSEIFSEKKLSQQPTTLSEISTKTTKKPALSQSVSSMFKKTPSTMDVLQRLVLSGHPNITVPSHRLLNDILVIPSSRRLYVLAILPIHESSNAQGFECGNVDVSAFIRLSALLKAFNDVNDYVLTESGLNIGAVVIDSCSSDLRTLADLFEVFSGTNINRSDIIAIVRDDNTYQPNIDNFIQQFKIPIINTHFLIQKPPMTVGMQPDMEQPITAMLDLLRKTQSTCLNVIHDNLYAPTIKMIQELAIENELCLDKLIALEGASSVEKQENIIRDLLLSDTEVVMILYDELSFLDFLKALNNEMVIPGRFLFLTLHNERWATSRLYLEAWPHFDQILLSVRQKAFDNAIYTRELTHAFPKLPFPSQWLRRFWSTAFKCHIDGSKTTGEQFSRVCSNQQALNLSSISPDYTIAPITFAVHSIAHALNRLVDSACQGALVTKLSDCVNDPYRSFFANLITANFYHPLANGEFLVNGSVGTPLVISRYIFDHGKIMFEQLATWDSTNTIQSFKDKTFLNQLRDGSMMQFASKCPKSACSRMYSMKRKMNILPNFTSSINNLSTLLFTILAIVVSFICMLCIYHQLINSGDDAYYCCNVFLFSSLTILTLVSIAFAMSPSSIACGIRKLCFSVAITGIYAPIVVRSFLTWRQCVTNRNLKISNTTIILSCVGLVAFQVVVVVQWAIFDNPTKLKFTHYEEDFSWRCFPGESFECAVILSPMINIIFILSSIIFNILCASCCRSKEIIAVCIFSLLTAVSFFFGISFLPLDIRDHVFAATILGFIVCIMLLTYATRLCTILSASSTESFTTLYKLSDNSSKMSAIGEFPMENHFYSSTGRRNRRLSYMQTPYYAEKNNTKMMANKDSFVFHRSSSYQSSLTAPPSQVYSIA